MTYELFKNPSILIDLIYPKNPYNIFNLILPKYYELILQFNANIIRKNNKRVLRTMINDKYIFYDDIFNDYNILLYSEDHNSILYYIDDHLYHKELNLYEKTHILNIKDIRDIRNIFRTTNKIKVDYHNIINEYNMSKNTELYNLFLHEVNCILDSEYRESYFEKYAIKDENIPIYIPIHLELYFIMNEIYSYNSQIISKENTIENIDVFISSANTTYNIIINNYVNIFNNIKIKIIKSAYNKYLIFQNEFKNIDNLLDKIQLYLKYNISIHTYRELLDIDIKRNKFIKTNNPKNINMTLKRNIMVRGGKRKTRKSKHTL